MRVILYCRVSTAEQADHGTSLQAQEAKLTAYAALYDLEAVETIVDAGESAKSLQRPGIQRALEMLRKGQADGIAVVKLDRLTRSRCRLAVPNRQLFFGPGGKAAIFGIGFD